MRDNLVSTPLPKAPTEYDQQYMNKLVDSIERRVTDLLNPGPIRVSRINIIDLPTDPAGLRVGDVWNESGHVAIVTAP